MDTVLLFKKDLDRYKTSELVILQRHFGLPSADRDDLVWMVAIYQAENNPRGTMRGAPRRSSDAPTYPLSKSGKQCTSICKRDSNNNCYCTTEPYTGWTGTYKWDYCNLQDCAALDRLMDWATGARRRTDRVIRNIEDAIAGRYSLDLTGEQLTELPAEIGQLTNLEELHLLDNQLTELPAEIGQLTNLQVLALTKNQLTELPAEIGQLSNLQRLYLDINQLTELPAEIGQLTNLEELHLNRNQLTELPAEIGQLTNLKRLYVDDNPLPDDALRTIEELQMQWREIPHTKSARKR